MRFRIADTFTDSLNKLTDTEQAKYGLTEGDILVNRVNSLSHLGKVALVRRMKEPTEEEKNAVRANIDACFKAGKITRNVAEHLAMDLGS